MTEENFRMADEFLGRLGGSRQSSKPKKRINKKLKRDVWLTYIGRRFDALCYSCNREWINPFNYHHGHVVAESQGGYTNLRNLRPICALCNLACGSKNLLQFAQENGYYDASICTQGPAKSLDQSAASI